MGYKEFLIEFDIGYTRKTYSPHYVVDMTNYSNESKLHYKKYFTYLSCKIHLYPLPLPLFIYAGGGIGLSFIWNEVLQSYAPTKTFYEQVIDLYPLVGVAYNFQEPNFKVSLETRYVYHSDEEFSMYTSERESILILCGITYKFGNSIKERK
jgi:hypothetical protein